MNQRILSLRTALAKEFRAQSNSQQFDYLLKHQGMFSLTGLTKLQTDSLREQHAIYIVEGGRINIAGLAQAAIPSLVNAFLQVRN
jgi:aspartate aminotransferase